MLSTLHLFFSPEIIQNLSGWAINPRKINNSFPDPEEDEVEKQKWPASLIMVTVRDVETGYNKNSLGDLNSWSAKEEVEERVEEN